MAASFVILRPVYYLGRTISATFFFLFLPFAGLASGNDIVTSFRVFFCISFTFFPTFRLLFHFFGYRIISSVIEGMTPNHSFQPQPTSFDRSKPINSLIGILRTGWMKSTKPLGKKKTEDTLIQRQRFLIKFYQNQ